jgi:hypothetical protein
LVARKVTAVVREEFPIVALFRPGRYLLGAFPQRAETRAQIDPAFNSRSQRAAHS